MRRSTRRSLRISAVVAVVEAGRPELLEQHVGAVEGDAVAAAHGGVSEGGGHECLADADGAEDQGVVAGVDEAQRAQLVEDLVVVVDLGGGVPVLQCHVGVESGGAGPQAGAGGLSAGDLVGEDELEELGVGQVALFGQGEPFGQGVEAAAQFDRPQQGLQLEVMVGAGVVMPHRLPGSRACCPGVRLVVAGFSGGEVAGVAGEAWCAAGLGGGGRRAAVWFSVARSIIRPMSATLTTSVSSARAHAASTLSGPHRLTRPSRA